MSKFHLAFKLNASPSPRWRGDWVIEVPSLRPYPHACHPVEEARAQLTNSRECLHDLIQPNCSCSCSRLAALYSIPTMKWTWLSQLKVKAHSFQHNREHHVMKKTEKSRKERMVTQLEKIMPWLMMLECRFCSEKWKVSNFLHLNSSPLQCQEIRNSNCHKKI